MTVQNSARRDENFRLRTALNKLVRGMATKSVRNRNGWYSVLFHRRSESADRHDDGAELALTQHRVEDRDLPREQAGDLFLVVRQLLRQRGVYLPLRLGRRKVGIRYDLGEVTEFLHHLTRRPQH